MTLTEPREFRVPFKLQMKRVAVSPEDADAFLRAMRAALGSVEQEEPETAEKSAAPSESEAEQVDPDAEAQDEPRG
jgi:hypothetical protein